MPDEPVQPQPQPGTGIHTIDAAGRVIGRVTTLSPTGMNNLVLVALGVGFAAFVYLDKQDRYERDALMLRHYEGQHESMRQVVTGNTVAVQALALQVGKLEQTVETFRRVVQTKMDEQGLADGDGAFVNPQMEVDFTAAVDAVPDGALAGADQFHVPAVVRGRGLHGADHGRGCPVGNPPVDRVAADVVLAGREHDSDALIRERGFGRSRRVAVRADERQR